jgi:uncharacterized spore protein YtfJ
MIRQYAGSPIKLAGVTLIPIEQLRIRSDEQPDAYWIHAIKEAIAVIICDENGLRVINIETPELSIEEFIRKVPELETLLAEIRSSLST